MKFRKVIIDKIGKDAFEFFFSAKNYVLSEGIAKLIGFMAIPIVTRILLPSDYGILSVYSAIIGVLSILLMLNFKGAVTRYYYEGKEDFNEFLGTVLVFLLFFNLLIFPLLWLIKNLIASFIGISENLFLLGVIASILMIPFTIYRFYLVGSKNSKEFSMITIINSVFVTGISIFWMLSLGNQKYLGKIYAQLLILLLIDIYAVYQLTKLSKFKFNFIHFKYAISFSVPLIFGSLSSFILNTFDRIIINQLTDTNSTGLYSFAYNIGMLMGIIIHSSNKSWCPIFYEKLKNNEKEAIMNLANIYTKVIFLFALGMIFFSKEIVTIMASEAYQKSFKIVPFIILGYIFNFLFIFYTNFLEYRKKTGIISINIFISATVNIILNYLFIPKFGYEIAAVTTLISFIVLFLLTYFSAKRVSPWIIPVKIFIKPSMVMVVILFIYLFIINYISVYSILLILKITLLLGTGYIYFKKRKYGDEIV